MGALEAVGTVEAVEALEAVAALEAVGAVKLRLFLGEMAMQHVVVPLIPV